MIYKQNKLDYKRVPLYLRFAPDVETNMMDLLTFDMKKRKKDFKNVLAYQVYNCVHF